jgi:hypothetical protein
MDVAQTRPKVGWNILAARGDQWAQGTFSGTWQDPVTGTLMLEPAPINASFFTSNTAPYNKLTVSDFTFTTSANWENRYGALFTGPVMGGKDAALTGENAYTTSTWAANTGAYICYFAYGQGARFWQLEFGWDNGATFGDSGPSFRVYSDGDIEAYYDGVLVKTGKIGPGAATQTGKWVEIMVLPLLARSILVTSPSSGGGFTFPVPGLDDDWSNTDNPTVLPATSFWWRVQSGAAQVGVAKIQYPSSGYCVSPVGAFPVQPVAGAPNSDTFVLPSTATLGDYLGWKSTLTGTPVAVSLVKSDGSTAYAGAELTARIKLSLTTSDTLRTPQVMGCFKGYQPIDQATDASEERNLDLYLMDASLAIAEDPASARFSCRIKNLAAFEIATPDFRSSMNRPVIVEDDGATIFTGRSSVVRWQDSAAEEAIFATFDVLSMWDQLERHQFRCQIPLDGLYLEDALAVVLKSAQVGYASKLEATGYRLPYDGGNEWRYLIESGDTAGQWAKRLVDDNAASWFYAIDQSGTFNLKSPATLNAQASSITFYRTMADAIAAGYTVDPWRYVFHEYEAIEVACEANEVVVTGYDARKDRPIQSVVQDLGSQDATLAPSGRPNNWTGEPWVYGLSDNGLSVQSQVEGAAALMFDQLAVNRQVSEITCQYILPSGVAIQPGQKITLHGIGDRMITAVSATFDAEGQDTLGVRGPVRMAKVVCSSIVARTPGVTLDEIKQDAQRRGISSVTIRRGSDALPKASPVYNVIT